ncbi:phosphatidylglycerophosphatase A family protein [Algiphilus sp.]|uniref:phosphatidylglycerophosphatase A family protein n=1 Tax=Algiphilus sp. TaxID=1872431 RepID=UPI0025BB6100|nr:phosphatidylglycerophosphatase A [Algiphilus sp.]MCK5771011.1 phosphatidylglycerophosphatase A [Algiphilus sp.]
MREAERRRVVRFPPGLILSSPVHILAFGFGSGLSRVAPGTFGTLPGVVLFLALSWLHVRAYAVALLALSALGIYLCSVSSRRLGVHDHPGIVFDEMVGYCVAALPILPALGWVAGPLWVKLAVVFVAFRIVDIAKPWPISWIDARVGGGFGIMLDDLVAGVIAGVLSWLVLHVLMGAMNW